MTTTLVPEPGPMPPLISTHVSTAKSNPIQSSTGLSDPSFSLDFLSQAELLPAAGNIDLFRVDVALEPESNLGQVRLLEAGAGDALASVSTAMRSSEVRMSVDSGLGECLPGGGSARYFYFVFFLS